MDTKKYHKYTLTEGQADACIYGSNVYLVDDSKSYKRVQRKVDILYLAIEDAIATLKDTSEDLLEAEVDNCGYDDPSLIVEGWKALTETDVELIKAKDTKDRANAKASRESAEQKERKLYETLRVKYESR